MDRRLTNAIRFVMDECLPPILRDSRWFMYPFYRIAYRGKNLRAVMNLKREVFAYTPQQYADFYAGLDSISRHRETDLNRGCIDAILESIDEEDQCVLDVGCGGGFLLRRLHEQFPDRMLRGMDVTTRPAGLPPEIAFATGDIMNFDVPADSADVVTCCHVLEHLIDYRQVLRKLVAAARRKVILVVPIQRPYFYTLDEHVNFFLVPEQFVYEVGLVRHHWQRIGGDLFYMGEK